MIFAGLAASIVFASLAFVFWNPLARPLTKVTFSTILRFVTGAGWAILSITLLVRTLPDLTVLRPFAIGTFVAALAVDALAGDYLRHRIGVGAEGSEPGRGSKQGGPTSPSSDAQRLDEGRE